MFWGPAQNIKVDRRGEDPPSLLPVRLEGTRDRALQNCPFCGILVPSGARLRAFQGYPPSARGALQTLVTHALSIIGVRDDNYTRCGKRLLGRTRGSGNVFGMESK